jgi:hypothetical protein
MIVYAVSIDIIGFILRKSAVYFRIIAGLYLIFLTFQKSQIILDARSMRLEMNAGYGKTNIS